jgi:hypothetical protein
MAADDKVRVWPDGPHWTPPDDIVAVLRSLADGYPEDVFPDPPEDQRCTDAGAAYVLRRVAVPWFTAAADSIEALSATRPPPDLRAAIATIAEAWEYMVGDPPGDIRTAITVELGDVQATIEAALEAVAGSATPTWEELAAAIERFLAPQRCTTPEGVGGSQPGRHCAACCMGTGWSEPSTMAELEAARALDAALIALRRAAAGSATPPGDEHVTEYGRGFAVPGEPGADVITTLRPDVQVLADAMCRHSMTSQWEEKAREVLRTLSANGWRLSAAGSATPDTENDGG